MKQINRVFQGWPENLIFHWCGYFESQGYWKHEERYSQDFELIVMVEGQLSLVIEGENIELSADDFLLIPPDTAFVGGRETHNLKFYWLHFGCDGLAVVSNGGNYERQSGYWQLPETSENLLLDHELVLLQQMQVLKKHDFPDHTLLSLYTRTLLQGLSDKYVKYHQNINTSHFLVDYIKGFIKWNYRNDLNVGSISDYFGYSPGYLSNLFSKESGITITEYLKRIRLESARQDLLTTNRLLREIAYDNGFTDEKYFSRVFSKQYRLSPREYRNKYGILDKM